MKDAKGHGSNKKPIPNSPYHAKSDMELRYIQKDAHEAGRNAQQMGDQKGVNKYADQVNDAATVLGYRARGGAQDAPGHGLIDGMQAKLSGDIAAGRMLASGSKSAPAPVHEAMKNVGPNSPLAGSRSHDPFGRPRDALALSEYDEATRDMQLRGRNGQIGSGMSFRG